MVGKTIRISNPEDLEIIGNYFVINVEEENEDELRISIKEEGKNFDNICLYEGKKGRVFIKIDSKRDYDNHSDYTDYLLFSPTGEVESSAIISSIWTSGEAMEFLVKKVMKTTSDFRKNLLKNLLLCKTNFNSNFRIRCKAKSGFFLL